jgi:hypothetical protein
MLLAVAGLLLALTGGIQTDVKGRWEVTLSGQRPDGTAIEDPALVILEQKGTTLTGSVGRDDNDRHPITSGTIEGNKVTLLAKHAVNEREYRVELTVANDEMKGTVSSGEMRANLLLKRKKP